MSKLLSLEARSSSSSVLLFTAGVAAELQTWAVLSPPAHSAIIPSAALISSAWLSESGPELAGSLISPPARDAVLTGTLMGIKRLIRASVNDRWKQEQSFGFIQCLEGNCSELKIRSVSLARLACN